MYLLVKNAHITFALISIGLFILRATWSVRESAQLDKPWVKIAPHLNDTLLLGCAVYLMVISNQYPFAQPWLTAKLLALLVYIVIGSIAIKRGKTANARLFASLTATAVFAYIFAVALSKSPYL